MKKIFSFLIALTLFMSSPVLAAVDTYTVQRGDSLWIIAVKYQVGLSEIISSNPQFDNPALIYPDQKVYVPLPDPVVKSMEEEILALVNKERASRGLSKLSLDWQISRVARYKSEDMLNNNYFSHQSPTYGSPFDMLKAFSISYSSAGENIAKGQKTAASVMNAWMNSEGHKKNILHSSFTKMGIGYAKGSTTYWTQIFTS